MHRNTTPCEPPESFVRCVAADRSRYVYPCDLRARVEAAAVEFMALLFPHFASDVSGGTRAVELAWSRAALTLTALIEPFAKNEDRPCSDTAAALLAEVPDIRQRLMLDAEAIHAGDPAAESLDEVILAYPGFYAIAVYRLAHALQALSVPILPRLLTEHAHERSGIDIHPAARIGSRFCIDHGTGIVIGATTEIGDDVKLYQGVTLGALSVAKDLAGAKRHPTLEDGVVVYSNATILGGSTVVGRGSVIGGNVWLTESVPPGSIVTRRAEIRVRSPHEAELEFHI